MTDADHDFLMKLSVAKKNILKRILVLIVITHRMDDNNNNNAIFNVVLHYRIIKYQYVNIIWIFIFFF